MLAHHVTRAGCSRASFLGVVSPPTAKEVELTNKSPNVEQNTTQNDGFVPSGRPAWKYAYEDILWSKQKLPLNLRAVLHVMLRLSDHLGRIWWSQAAIAEQAGCTVRTLRRLLPALQTSGFARVEPMTFRQLALAQAALGLPLPGRNDDGQAPDLITLLVDGKPALELRPASRKRSPSPGQIVPGAPRTSLSFELPKNPADPADNSSADPRDLSVDLYRNVGDPMAKPHPSTKVFLVQENQTPKQVETSKPGLAKSAAPADLEQQAWMALEAAYDAHYKRVYLARPTNKPLPVETRMLMAGHLADMATLLHARFVERNTDPSTLPKRPVELLVDEALRVWFDSAGTNDYLRRVSHRMSALLADLPYRVRKAIDVLLDKHAAKPEPRRALPSVATLVSSVERTVPESSPSPALVAPAKPTVAKTNLSSEVRQVLDGLSQHASLHDLAQTPTLANELVSVAKDHDASVQQIVETLEVAAKVCQRQRMAPSSVRSSLVYKLVVHHLVEKVAQRSTA